VHNNITPYLEIKITPQFLFSVEPFLPDYESLQSLLKNKKLTEPDI